LNKGEKKEKRGYLPRFATDGGSTSMTEQILSLQKKSKLLGDDETRTGIIEAASTLMTTKILLLPPLGSF